MARDEKDEFKHIEFRFPLLLLKTRRGRGLMDRLSKSRLTPPLETFYLYIMPIIAAIMIYLALFAIFRYITTPSLSSFVRGLGIRANFLLPGLNPYLPIVYGWIALWIGLIVHEGSHGIVARRQGFTVKDSGLIFFAFIPIGAFVELDEEELKKASPSSAGRILAAGAGSNFAVAIISLLLMLLVVSTFIPVSSQGIAIVSVQSNYPASQAGLSAGDILLSVNSTVINRTSQLSEFLMNTHAGDSVSIQYIHQGVLHNAQITLAKSPYNQSIGYMGINAADNPSIVLKNFLSFSPLSISRYFIFPSLVSSQIPFSDQMQIFYTSWLGFLAVPLANLLFWVWFVNLNLALFNALPLGPFDGGVAFRHLLRALTHSDWDSKIVRNISNSVTLLMLMIVIALIAAPYLF